MYKLYHKEADTAEFELILKTIKITGIFLSEVTKIEFTSAVWKKLRTKDITLAEAERILFLFASDFRKYTFVAIDSIIIEQA
ncbi:MAG: type II toxin-antitoxin system VapC family toxin [Bacteroidota bacterium]|nr:type II toxin-antitoxin system VapC family toxin [Bacteroidota bacterium]